ncbi:MAG: hypothetical protein E7390_06090 [Ruminococcaceae bacterium]|nr:hypothetical protein [Oscillospiraceae bacterium]
MNATFEVGFDRRRITPSVGARLYGYPNNRISESVHDDLHVNAVVFRSGETAAVLLNFELCGVTTELANEIRKQIQECIGIPYKNCIVTCTHTHSGPSVVSSYGWGEADDIYIENILLPNAIESVEKAFQSLKPAEMGIGQTNSFVGINRRERQNGKAVLGQNPEGIYDPKMFMLAFRSVSGEPIVNLIHFGAHPTACGPGPEITRDWPGYMVDRVEAETGAPAVFCNGAEGDVGPRLSNGKTIGDITYVEEVGTIAGEDAMRAWGNIACYAVPEVKVYTELISLPYEPIPTREEAAKTLVELGTPINGVDFKLEERCKKIIQFYEENQSIETEWTFEQTVLRIGSVVFVPYPFEMFCGITLEQQEKSPFPYTLCLCNANGCGFYMPTEEEISFGGYEVGSFKNKGLFTFTNDAGKRIVLENQRLIEKLL